MQGKQHEGIQFMSQTLKDWEKCGGLAIHNHWHRTLYELELGHFNKVLEMYDKNIRANKSTVVLV